MSITLVLGGARSGKSRFAESLGHGERVYIATAQAFDNEMRERIAKHQMQRGPAWRTIEEPFKLVEALQRENIEGRFILVDCLTLWLSNLMLADMDWKNQADLLVSELSGAKSDIVLVSNEVGLGIVPDTPLGRKFRDAQGIVNQRVAAQSGSVVMMLAGLAMAVKGPLPQQKVLP